jgi:acyl-CoA thioesterase-2
VAEPGVPSLRATLDLEQIDEHYFRGVTLDDKTLRVFGGQVAGQALVAAGRTVPPDKSVHSLHAYFLRPGDPKTPIMYDVDIIRDGRSFATRRVVAVQNGEAIFNLAASFHVNEPGLVHQAAVMDSPMPDTLPPIAELLTDADPALIAWHDDLYSRFPIEAKFVDGIPFFSNDDDPPPARRRIWLRIKEPLGDDPLTHVCAAAYASDFFLLGSALAPHNLHFGRGNVTAVSLDHAMWFHAGFRADNWMLYDQMGTWTGQGRGLARGQIFNQAGELVATVTQEGLIRFHT